MGFYVDLKKIEKWCGVKKDLYYNKWILQVIILIQFQKFG
jgi:hypothetical protein